MSVPTYRELWKRLYDTTQNFLVKSKPARTADTVSSAKEKGPATQQHAFPPLDLTTPPDFVDFLYGLDLAPSALQAARTRVYQAIDEQKVLHDSKYQQVCAKFAQLYEPSTSAKHANYYQSLKKSHEISFRRQLDRIQETLLKVYEDVRSKSSQSNKPAFNSEYTPVLEQYFEYNAYPSARDRELLARKSSMTARQIEVWFQNHRRRARQEGRSLKRISTNPLPASLSLRTLKEQMPSFMLRKEERRSPSLEKEIPTEPTPSSPHPIPTPTSPEVSLDDTPSSPTAWPAIYSPQDRPSLFTSSRTYYFEEPAWPRKPTSSSPRASPSPSVNELCSEFRNKLHLGGGVVVRKQHDCKYLPRSVATSRQRHAFALPPPPASESTSLASPSSADVPIKFGTSSFHSRKRYQPYDLSSRNQPNWSLGNPKPRSALSRPSTSCRKLTSPIPRTPSLSSISSSDSSYCSDPPTPRDSPSSFIQSLPQVIETLDEGAAYDPYAFDFSSNTVISSYPSSTERYTSYTKPLPSSWLSASPSYSRSVAY